MASSLTIRSPRLPFDPDRIIWKDAPEISVIFNAMSTSTPVVEIFLNKVMMAVRKRVGGEDPSLRRDIDDFVRQESNHYRIHADWNALIEDAGFHLDPVLENRFNNEYKELLKKRSLSFLAAYCAGFENFTLFFARYIFEKGTHLFREGDSIGDLWRWHFAEEFEHRMVCHDGFAVVSGNYFLRVGGLLYSAWHLNRNIAPRIRSFLDQYREEMTPEQLKASRKRERAFLRSFYGWTLPRMAKILMPFYSPGRARPSAGMAEALGHYDTLSELEPG